MSKRKKVNDQEHQVWEIALNKLKDDLAKIALSYVSDQRERSVKTTHLSGTYVLQ